MLFWGSGYGTSLKIALHSWDSPKGQYDISLYTQHFQILGVIGVTCPTGNANETGVFYQFYG